MYLWHSKKTRQANKMTTRIGLSIFAQLTGLHGLSRLPPELNVSIQSHENLCMHIAHSLSNLAQGWFERETNLQPSSENCPCHPKKYEAVLCQGLKTSVHFL